MCRSWAAVLALLLALCPQAFAWGREGHAVVVHLAWLDLTPVAKAHIQELLNPGESLEQFASWADDVRHQRPETSPWHFINIPITAHPSGPNDWKAYCPHDDCVVAQINRMMVRVHDRSLPRDQRREALFFLIHFVADVHQPLHAGGNDDRGGGQVPVLMNTENSNLHVFWDWGVLNEAYELKPGLRAKIRQKPGFWTRFHTKQGTPASWAWESAAQARKVAYGKLPPGRPVRITHDYVRHCAPVAEKQIRTAGIRLGRVLNRVLG